MKSLAARLVVTYVALIIAMTSAAGIGIVTLTRKYFVDAERQSLLVQARLVAASCNDTCVASGSQPLTFDERVLPPASNISRGQQNAPSDYSLDQVDPAAQQNLQAVVPSNIVILTSTANASTLTSQAKQALAGREATTTSQRSIVAAVPIRRGAAVVGAVQATGSLDNVQSVLNDVRRQVLIALIASAILATLIGIWRARAIALPVRALTVAAHELSIGNFDAPLPVARSADELGELTTAFDTLRRAVQAELRARSAFVGDASHELRTPLTAMRGAVEILRSDAGTRPEVRERFLTSLDTEMNRLLKLVEDLLTLNQADHSERTDQALTPVDVGALLHEVVLDLQPLGTQRHIEIRMQQQPSLDSVVMGQPSALRQLLINVIDNAMIHAPDGKTINIDLRSAAGGATEHVVLDVRDHGPGIAPEDRERVFERFTRLDSARARNSGGAGLGLSIARTIARDHHGDVTFIDPLDGGSGVVTQVVLPLRTNQTI
jgi:two-component system, OmpR family, sensor kinase